MALIRCRDSRRTMQRRDYERRRLIGCHQCKAYILHGISCLHPKGTKGNEMCDLSVNSPSPLRVQSDTGGFHERAPLLSVCSLFSDGIPCQVACFFSFSSNRRRVAFVSFSRPLSSVRLSLAVRKGTFVHSPWPPPMSSPVWPKMLCKNTLRIFRKHLFSKTRACLPAWL